VTEFEPITGLTLSPEAIAEADDLAAQLSCQREWGPFEARDLIADALQRHINRLEFAEAQRKQAVAAANILRDRVRESVDRIHVDAWVTCPRCHVRAPSVPELRHEPGCRLSSAPPPRRSLIAPKTGEEG
jgi:hypothetical protein